MSLVDNINLSSVVGIGIVAGFFLVQMLMTKLEPSSMTIIKKRLLAIAGCCMGATLLSLKTTSGSYRDHIGPFLCLSAAHLIFYTQLTRTESSWGKTRLKNILRVGLLTSILALSYASAHEKIILGLLTLGSGIYLARFIHLEFQEKQKVLQELQHKLLSLEADLKNLKNFHHSPSKIRDTDKIAS